MAHGVRRVAMEGGVGRSSIDVLDAVTSGIASMFRPTSAFVSGYRAQLDQSYKNTFDLPLREFSESLPTNRPQKTLELYEFEACPFCRKVRLGPIVPPAEEAPARFSTGTGTAFSLWKSVRTPPNFIACNGACGSSLRVLPAEES